MTSYLIFVLKRFGQFLLVVFLGVTITFFVTHLTPIDPVEESIGAITQMGQSDPNAIELMRQSLRELYGMEGTIWQQYLHFWLRLATGDLGPSLSAFPTPVSTIILRSLPWTIGLMTVATLITFVLGNAIGALAGYYRKDMVLKAVSLVFIALLPIPYYILAFVLLIVFGYLWPVLPISGGAQMNLARGFSAAYLLSLAQHAVLPVASLVLVGLGGWFMGMRSLVSNIVNEDYVTYAELGGVAPRTILTSYVMRNALVPQVTGLAMSLGAIFTGAIITEQVFGYPGIGTLLVSAVHAGDYSLVLGIASVSIVSVASAVLLIDLLYPLLDPRVKAR